MPAAAFAGALTTILFNIGVALVLTYAAYVLTPRPKAIKQSNELLHSVRGSILPWRVIYGQTRVGGMIAFTHDDGDYSWVVIVLACHEVEEISEIWADDKPVTLGSWGALTGTNGVADGSGDWLGKIRVARHYGSGSQVVSPELSAAATLWDADHELLGRAYIVVRATNDNTFYSNGLPNFTAIVKGRKVYDVRTDTTIWSANSALCIADYLYNPNFGVGAGAISGSAYTEIDDATLVAQANICDENVNLDPSGTEDRYTMNGAFDVANGRRYTHEDQQLDYPGDLGFEFVIAVAAGQTRFIGKPLPGGIPSYKYTEREGRG